MMHAPKDVARALVDAYNAKSLEATVNLYRPDGRYWDPLHQDGVDGREAIGNVIAGLFAAVPDERLEIETLAGDERYAVAELRSTGTVAATGARFELELTEVYEVVGRQIASCRAYFDPKQLPREARVDVVAHLARDTSAPGTETKGRMA